MKTSDMSDEGDDEVVETGRAIANKPAQKHKWKADERNAMLIAKRWTHIDWKEVPRLLNHAFPAAGGGFHRVMAKADFDQAKIDSNEHKRNPKTLAWQDIFETTPFNLPTPRILHVLNRLERHARAAGLSLRRKVQEDYALHRKCYREQKRVTRTQQTYHHTRATQTLHTTSTDERFVREFSQISVSTGFLSIKDENENDFILVEETNHKSDDVCSSSDNDMDMNEDSNDDCVLITTSHQKESMSSEGNNSTINEKGKGVYHKSSLNFDFGK
jgi:hypothetical protein